MSDIFPNPCGRAKRTLISWQEDAVEGYNVAFELFAQAGADARPRAAAHRPGRDAVLQGSGLQD